MIQTLEPSFTILEHPADVGVEARGPTFAAVCDQAARGLLSLFVDPASVNPAEERSIDIRAGDREQLVMRFLSDILYLYDGTGFVPSDVTVHQADAGHISATLRGERCDRDRHRLRTDVKAVTYHQMEIVEDRGGWKLRVFFDI
jgi:SHS2 domain-containing protein